jgi:hypothetical protein
MIAALPPPSASDTAKWSNLALPRQLARQSRRLLQQLRGGGPGVGAEDAGATGLPHPCQRRAHPSCRQLCWGVRAGRCCCWPADTAARLVRLQSALATSAAVGIWLGKLS